jgi:hypothetical protein
MPLTKGYVEFRRSFLLGPGTTFESQACVCQVQET